jgi:hypothetical protein
VQTWGRRRDRCTACASFFDTLFSENPAVGAVGVGGASQRDQVDQRIPEKDAPFRRVSGRRWGRPAGIDLPVCFYEAILIGNE